MLPSPHARLVAVLFAALTLPALGCQSTPPADSSCTDGKCDDPGSAANRECKEKCGADQACFAECREEKALAHCEARRNDAVASAQKAFTPTAIRWAASDVEGVNTNGRDDRGQEYVEYYAIVAPPPATEGEAAPAPIDLGRAGSQQPLGLELTDDQIFALEDDATATVGQCIFHSWHADIRDQLPVCNGSATTCPEFALPAAATLPAWMSGPGLGLTMTQEMLRMKIGFNSNGAASDLAMRCMGDPLEGDPTNPDDPLNDDYMRGCMLSFKLFGTEWRRSDPTICAATARAAECGCGVDTDGDGVADITDPTEIAFALIPRQPGTDGTVSLRGFRLGTWSDENGLPAGCRYLDTGDDSNTVVACDLTASDLLAGAADVKGTCRAKYGDNVVVHIPIPEAAIVCSPPTDGAYSGSCGQMVPWTAPDGAPSSN
jgi:hypothetical protein